jgi:hypothetical protein
MMLPLLIAIVEIDDIPAGDVQGQRLVVQTDVRHQGIVGVVEYSLPGRPNPTEAAIYKKSEAARVARGMVLLPHVWEVDVANAVVGIERHEERAVSDWNIPCHADPPSSVSPSHYACAAADRCASVPVTLCVGDFCHGLEMRVEKVWHSC